MNYYPFRFTAFTILSTERFVSTKIIVLLSGCEKISANKVNNLKKNNTYIYLFINLYLHFKNTFLIYNFFKLTFVLFQNHRTHQPLAQYYDLQTNLKSLH